MSFSNERSNSFLHLLSYANDASGIAVALVKRRSVLVIELSIQPLLLET